MPKAPLPSTILYHEISAYLRTMVTAFKVEASSIDDYFVDSGGAASSYGVGVNNNLKSEDEETKNDAPTLKRNHHELTNTFACNSWESSTESINNEGGLSSTTNSPYRSEGFMSYSKIEAMCGDTSIGCNYYAVPHANNIIKAKPTTAKDNGEAAVAKRPRLENGASARQHGTSKNDCTMNKVQFAKPTGFRWNNNQLQQQLYLPPSSSSASAKKKASPAPKQQKVGSTRPKATPIIDATFKRQVQQEQQKLQSAIKTTSKTATVQDKSDSAKYGQRGVTMRASSKWQVQYYYYGKSRYIGVFESKTIALAAYETTRQILESGRGESGQNLYPLNEEEAKSNIIAAKKAVFDALDASDYKEKKDTSASKRQKVQRLTNGSTTSKATPMIDATFCRQAMQEQQKDQSALLKTTSNFSTQGMNDATSISHGKDGQTMQQQWKSALLKITSNATTTQETTDVVYGKHGHQGICLTPGNKWQVQYYYCRRMRYIGTFDSKLIASAAYEKASEILGPMRGKHNQKELSEKEVKSNLELAKKAVFDAFDAGKLSEKDV